MIRTATAGDIPEVTRLAAEFHAYSPYRDYPFDPDAFSAFAGRLIEGGIIFLSDDGFIAGLLNPLFFNPSVVMGAELMWFARKEGRALREAFEAWAREQGAVGVQFSGLADDQAEAIRRNYERAGYQPVETAYLKRF